MDAAPVIQALVQQVESAPLALHTAALPAPRHRSLNSAAVIDALRYVRDTLRGYGWQIADQLCFDPVLGHGVNVVATLPGLSRPDALVVVGAHHDTVPGSPGADDNSSGVAALLELGRVLGRRRWAVTIQLVAFDFEEHGFLGSQAYVESLARAPVELRGAFILEMIGYSSRAVGSQRIPAGFEQRYPDAVRTLDEQGRRGNFLAALGNQHRSGLLDCFRQWAALGAPDLPLIALEVPAGSAARQVLRSDHVPFWEAGLPAVMLTDTANYRNPHYHQPSDRSGTLDPAFWRRVVTATLAAVAALAEPR